VFLEVIRTWSSYYVCNVGFNSDKLGVLQFGFLALCDQEISVASKISHKER
jgi:hypothetical protein